MVRDSRMVRDGRIIDVAPDVWSARRREPRPPVGRLSHVWHAARDAWPWRLATGPEPDRDFDDVEWVWAFLRHDSTDY